MVRHPWRGSNSGLILIVVMWILLILSLLAVGLGRSARLELSLTQYFTGQWKSKSIARSGVVYAFNQIRQDTQDERTSSFDSLHECAVKLSPDHDLSSLFKNIPVGEGHFDIRYSEPRGEMFLEETWGFEDEERKLNLNALTPETCPILQRLIVKLGFDESAARTLASSVVDWIDEDGEITDEPYGAEDSHYHQQAHPYTCKNLPFDSLEELFFIQGMTKEIFKELKDYVTIFPQKSSRLLVNINTASSTVIGALAEHFSGPATNTDIRDAESLTRKIIDWRLGEDRQPLTADDRIVDMNELSLNAAEEAIYRALQPHLTEVSTHIRIKVWGVHESSGVVSRIEAVVKREDLSIVFWRRD